MIQVQASKRERNRQRRLDGYLAAGLRIATTDGLHAVTMQRLADELDCAVGTVYTYFPSKSGLVAEVQRAAVERLTASYRVLEAELGDVEPLTHALAVARFWIDIGHTYPQETRLLQLLMSQTEQTLTDEDALRVVPAALIHMELGRARLAAAADAGALSPGDPLARAITLAAAINGVVQVGRLARLAPELLDGDRLAAALVDDLLIGWGADLGALALAHSHLDALAATGPLARPLPENER